MEGETVRLSRMTEPFQREVRGGRVVNMYMMLAAPGQRPRVQWIGS